ncbi:OprO/OprP family phosphate-selective porin [Bacteroidia bacterium]|nr:OprO/OprP family phosphate-selective porin [Bacteroidia bacterium]
MENRHLILLVVACFTFMVNAQVSYPSVEKGLSFKSADGKVKMGWSFRLQSLASYQNDMDGNSEDMKALVRRMRLKSKGYIYSPKFEYKLELALSNRDQGNSKDAAQVSAGSKIVLDAVLKYHLGKKQQLWFGQTKLPGNRERVISSMALQFVDRSNVNSKFNIDRDFGVQYRLSEIIGEMPIKIAAAVTTGEGRNITANNESSGMAYTGRLEFYPLGAFTKKGDYFSADLMREEKGKLAIGATYSYNQNTTRSGGQLGSFVYNLDTNGNATSVYSLNDMSTLFIDAIYKHDGLSIMGEYANRTLSKDISGYSSGTGYVGQVGYLFDNNMEVSGRCTSVDLSKGLGTASNTTEYTLGLSKYIVGHKLKVQSDIAYIDSESATVADYRIRFQIELGI